ncbi:MAG: hypothetical protein OES09_06185 [Gammaproteobacteria bacterium]|nr:hypothetical protein [Gammaproteobacteria bacterium]
MKSIARAMLLSGLVLPAATAFAVDIDQAAEDGCACMRGPYAKIEALTPLISEAMVTGDASKIMGMQGELEGLMNAAQACFEDLNEKYPEIDSSQVLKDQATALMSQKCPRPPLGLGMPPKTQ